MQTVYKAVSDQKAKDKKQNSPQKDPKKQESGEKNTGGKDNNKKSPEKPSDGQKPPPSACRTCSSLGFPGEMHWHSKCPRQDEAMAILTRHASECSSKPTNHVRVITSDSKPSAQDSQDSDPYGGATYYANLKAKWVMKNTVLKASDKPSDGHAWH